MRHWAARFGYCILYARYLLASAFALGADVSSYFLLVQLTMPAVLASVVGYMFGIAVHWLLSTRIVFAQEAVASAAERMRQKVLFIASALVGLAITVAVVGQGLRWGFDPGLIKLVAVGIAFQATYLLRRRIVFS
jgi:putative flippase GtrA